MTVKGKSAQYNYGDYSFELRFDSTNIAGMEQRDIYWQRNNSDKDKEPQYIRSFYYSDAVPRIMRDFCSRFASDLDYRENCLSDKMGWCIRDSLFLKNVVWTDEESGELEQALGSRREVYDFFKQNWHHIIAKPEYRVLYEKDDNTNHDSVDPEIKEAVDQFNSINGVKVKISCQGITGRINYRGLLINIISVHDKLGYIVFETVPSAIGQKLIHYMGSTQATICVDFQRERNGSFSNMKIESIGNNMIFRKEVLKIARALEGC